MARQRRQSRLRALRRHLAPPTPTSGGGGAAPLARTKAHTFDVALMHDPRPYLPAEDPPSAHQPELTAEEVERFKQTGVICKRQLLPVVAPLRRWVASKGDWPRRIAEYARDDQEDAAAYAANY